MIWGSGVVDGFRLGGHPITNSFNTFFLEFSGFT